MKYDMALLTVFCMHPQNRIRYGLLYFVENKI